MSYGLEHFKDELKEAFLERFEGIEDENGEVNEEYEPEQYWQDQISDIADEAIPLDEDELFELWMSLGRPDVDDMGGVEGVRDITQIVQWTIYEQANSILYEMAYAHGLN